MSAARGAISSAAKARTVSRSMSIVSPRSKFNSDIRTASRSGTCFCDLLQGVEAGDVPGQRTGGDGVGTAEPSLARARPPRKIPVDGGDADLVLARRLTGTAVIASAATGRDHLSANGFEGLQIS